MHELAGKPLYPLNAGLAPFDFINFSICLAVIAVFPYIITRFVPNMSFNFASFYGGTSLLIIVGVALDTLQQLESHLMMRHYDGFMKGSSKIRGRRRM